MRWGLVVGVALVASIGTNVYLLIAGPAEQARGHRRISQRPPRPAPQTPPTKPVPEEIGRVERVELEKRLAVAEAKLDKVLPLELKFERAEPDPDSEARLQPALDKMFNEGSEYTLECRGRVCRIAAPNATEDWRKDFQSAPELVGMFKGMSVGRTITVELEAAPRTAEIQTVTAPIYALLASPALATCKREHLAEGTLWLSLKIEARRFVVKARGPLADQAIGVCVRRALEDIASKTPIPSEVTSTEEVPFPVPLP